MSGNGYIALAQLHHATTLSAWLAQQQFRLIHRQCSRTGTEYRFTNSTMAVQLHRAGYMHLYTGCTGSDARHRTIRHDSAAIATDGCISHDNSASAPLHVSFWQADKPRLHALLLAQVVVYVRGVCACITADVYHPTVAMAHRAGTVDRCIYDYSGATVGKTILLIRIGCGESAHLLADRGIITYSTAVGSKQTTIFFTTGLSITVTDFYDKKDSNYAGTPCG